MYLCPVIEILLEFRIYEFYKLILKVQSQFWGYLSQTHKLAIVYNKKELHCFNEQ